MGNMANVKQAYTNSEWDAREQYYVNEVGKIVLPADPTTKDIMRLTAQIDSLLGEALLDLTYVRRKFQNLDLQMKLAEKETFVILKATPPTAMQGIKLTEADVKGLVVQHLKTNFLPGMKHSVYDLVSSVEHRMVFMETLVKVLAEKKGALVTDNAMMKIEASIGSGAAPTTPNQKTP